jgi:hypothetical protein
MIDAEALGQRINLVNTVFNLFIKYVNKKNITTLEDLEQISSDDDWQKFMRSFVELLNILDKIKSENK